jgi:DNA-binding response OmpR family regulator
MARVLLVDDDADGLPIRKLVLERNAHQVMTAADAETARTLFQQTRPDIVILDLRVPGLADGLALIREFRAASPAVRIVVLAGWSADLDGRAEAAMVDEILAKPVPSRRLVQAVEG